jgi:DNA-directed RNA polymerase specialized sigma subunit
LGIDKVFDRVYNNSAMAKYDTLRKLDRNEMLREYAAAHPELSLNEIGQRFNISASRVWRIIHGNKKNGTSPHTWR